MDIEELSNEHNARWEATHQKIVAVLKKSMSYAESPPTVTEIAEQTGLSRKTVYQHLYSCSTSSAHLARNKYYSLMEADVLVGITKHALHGDMRAARLFLEMLGRIQPRMGAVAGTTNIQINGINLNQQILQNLSEEQLDKIEAIIKAPYHGYEIQKESRETERSSKFSDEL